MITDLAEVETILNAHAERLKALEKFFPKDFSLPKSRRRKKSEAEKVIEQSLRKTMFK